ncbi:MAG: WYL domain-containing protein [Chloroflexi bacterium]|nr:WYL domain-containing protein [Chloroflexota bacterium]
MSRSISRAARLRQIEHLLFRNPHGLRVTEIAEHCGVNRRTIYRDLEVLDDTGVPIWQADGKYGIIRDQYLATVRLRFSEAVALYIAARLLARHADERNPHIVSALHKLATAFPDPLSDYINRTAEAISEQPVNPAFVDVLEVVTICWAEGAKVRLWYRSPRSGNVRPRDIAPYTVEPSASGGLYVIGFDDWASDIRTFKLERVERADRLPDTYDIPASFDPRTHLADAWGIMAGDDLEDIVLRFSPKVAAYIRERIWHPSQTITDRPDGGVDLAVRIAEPVEMRPWIRSWGAEVEVLKPAYLRHDIGEEARRTAARYTENSSQ